MSRASIGWLFAVCLFGGVAAAEAGPALLMGPHVNRVDGTSARILWVSEAASPEAQVTVEGGGQTLKPAPATSAIAGRDEVLHTVAVEGLRPFTRYRYRVAAGGEIAEGSFRTAAREAVPFRFVVYGDTRSRPEQHLSVSKAIAAEEPAFVVCNGDLVANGTVWEQWKREFFDPAMPYLRKSALWPVRGNHEEDAVFYRELFDLPGNELYYSFDFGDVHSVVLDSNLGGDERRAMLEWFEHDLAANQSRWVFVSQHHPTFNIGGHGSTWGREDFLPVMEKYGVDFVIAGHSHLYERFMPIGPRGKKPVIHIVSGGGGAPTYPAGYSPILAGGIGNSELHFCCFEIDGDRCEMITRRPDGSVLDRLSLVKREGMYQDKVMVHALDTETAESIAFMFRDLEADFLAIPRPGERVEVALKASSIRQGSVVVVAQAKDDGQWKVRKQKIGMVDGRAVFEVTAPRNLSVGLKGFDPPLTILLEVDQDGGSYSADSVAPRLSDDTFRRMVPEPAPAAVPYSQAAIVVDGDLSEWDGISTMPLPFLKRATSSFRFCWREEGLYGAVVAEDDSIEANPSAPWQADSVELFIDKDFARSPRRTLNAAQYVFSPAPESGPGEGHIRVAYGADRRRQTEIQCAWAPAPGGYVLEFLIPAEALRPARMRAGCTLGMNFALNDDGTPVELFYSDKDGDGWQSPITWGAVQFKK